MAVEVLTPDDIAPVLARVKQLERPTSASLSACHPLRTH